MPDSEAGSERAFWQWFGRAVLPALRGEELPREDVVAELDDRLRSFALPWELGPDADSDKWCLAVSFMPARDRFQAAMRLVNAAPEMGPCRVVLGKQAKEDWDGRLELRTTEGWVTLRPTQWPTAALRTGPGVTLVVAPIESGLPEEEVCRATGISAINLLGEVRYYRQIKDVLVMSRRELQAIGSPFRPLAELKELLDAALE